MKKSILSLAFVLASIGSQAGGLVTNTNQNAAFLRNFAQVNTAKLQPFMPTPQAVLSCAKAGTSL